MEAHCHELQTHAYGLSLRGSSLQLRQHANILLDKVTEWLELTRRLALEIKKNPNALGVAAVDYLMYAGHISLAAHWLRMEEVSTGLRNSQVGDVQFHDAKIKV